MTIIVTWYQFIINWNKVNVVSQIAWEKGVRGLGTEEKRGYDSSPHGGPLSDLLFGLASTLRVDICWNDWQIFEIHEGTH